LIFVEDGNDNRHGAVPLLFITSVHRSFSRRATPF